jgi:hypothetical protein
MAESVIMRFEPGPGSAPLGEVELVPIEEQVRGLLTTDVKVLFSAPNRVVVQNIFVQPFTDDVVPEALEKTHDQEVAPLATRWNGKPDIKVVSSHLTCLPAPGCRMTWLRASFELGVGVQDGLRPIVCAMFPQTQQDTIKITSGYEISNKLTIKAIEGGAKRTGGTEHQESTNRITTYGAFGPSPAWDMNGTVVNPEIQGDLRLVMVVAAPPGSKTPCDLALSGRAELRALKIPLVTRRTGTSAGPLRFEI